MSLIVTLRRPRRDISVFTFARATVPSFALVYARVLLAQHVAHHIRAGTCRTRQRQPPQLAELLEPAGP
jgi:hypothetical protein